MEKESAPAIRHELFDYLAAHPEAASSHANWMAAGGERILDLMVNAVRGDMFPYTAEPHVQASFGAFVGGVAWAAKMLRNLVALANNRSEALRMLAQADASLSEEERRILREHYGYSAEEIEKMNPPNRRAKAGDR